MSEENFNDFDENDDDSLIIVTDDGEELPLQILSSRENGSDIFLLAVEPESGDVFHFLCKPAADDEEAVTMELIDDEHEQFERVFEMFKDDYEEFGIETEE